VKVGAKPIQRSLPPHPAFIQFNAVRATDSSGTAGLIFGI
jgi:hypothetical protein